MNRFTPAFITKNPMQVFDPVLMMRQISYFNIMHRKERNHRIGSQHRGFRLPLNYMSRRSFKARGRIYFAYGSAPIREPEID
jgi:hypothetical protein